MCLNVGTQLPSGARGFTLNIHTCLYLRYASRECSGENVQMDSLARAFAARQCDKYQVFINLLNFFPLDMVCNSLHRCQFDNIMTTASRQVIWNNPSNFVAPCQVCRKPRPASLILQSVSPVIVNKLTLYVPVSFADNICKQFGPWSGPTKRRAWSGSKLFDTLEVFMKEYFENVNV